MSSRWEKYILTHHSDGSLRTYELHRICDCGILYMTIFGPDKVLEIRFSIHLRRFINEGDTYRTLRIANSIRKVLRGSPLTEQRIQDTVETIFALEGLS